MACWDAATDLEVKEHRVTHDLFETGNGKLARFHDRLRNQLRSGVVPIINEDDTKSTEEIDRQFGDNDELAAMVWQRMG
jgi:glutamate 5-kinase